MYLCFVPGQTKSAGLPGSGDSRRIGKTQSGSEKPSKPGRDRPASKVKLKRETGNSKYLQMGLKGSNNVFSRVPNVRFPCSPDPNIGAYNSAPSKKWPDYIDNHQWVQSDLSAIIDK
jgi:hypothetical protein